MSADDEGRAVVGVSRLSVPDTARPATVQRFGTLLLMTGAAYIATVQPLGSPRPPHSNAGCDCGHFPQETSPMPNSASLRARRNDPTPSLDSSRADDSRGVSPSEHSPSECSPSGDRPVLTLWQRVIGRVPPEHVRTVPIATDDVDGAADTDFEAVMDTGGVPVAGDLVVVHDPARNENTEHPWHPAIPVPASLHPLGISLAVVALRRASTR